MDEVTEDQFGAFCPGRRVVLEGAGKGPLAGLTFAAKDNFDVAGFVTGAGSPDWQRAQSPARVTSVAVQRLVEITLPVAQLDGCPIGLSLVGSVNSDEHLLDRAVDLTTACPPLI